MKSKFKPGDVCVVIDGATEDKLNKNKIVIVTRIIIDGDRILYTCVGNDILVCKNKVLRTQIAAEFYGHWLKKLNMTKIKALVKEQTDKLKKVETKCLT